MMHGGVPERPHTSLVIALRRQEPGPHRRCKVTATVGEIGLAMKRGIAFAVAEALTYGTI
jgi:hypothetical protein